MCSMRWMWKAVVGLALALVLIAAGVFVWLAASPPEILRVGDGYAAKIVCSNTFVAGRDPQQVLEDDVQAPGNPALRLVRVSVDRDEGVVTASILGMFAPNYALYRGGLGCTNVPDGDLQAARSAAFLQKVKIVPNDSVWPAGDRVAIDQGETSTD